MDLKIHVTHEWVGGQGGAGHHDLGTVVHLLHDLARKVDNMASQVFTDMEALRKAVDDASTLVAKRITDLTAGIKNSMTDEEVAALKAELGATAANLNAMGKPAEPVPPLPPLAAASAKTLKLKP